jgi:hypothetical protein
MQFARRGPPAAPRPQEQTVRIRPNEGIGLHESLTAFMVRTVRDHFDGPACLRRAAPHHAASDRRARGGRTHDFKLRVVDQTRRLEPSPEFIAENRPSLKHSRNPAIQGGGPTRQHHAWIVQVVSGSPRKDRGRVLLCELPGDGAVIA